MQNIKAKFLCKSFLVVKFVISVAKGNRGEKGDGKHQTLVERPVKRQLYLAGFLTQCSSQFRGKPQLFIFLKRLLSPSACFRPAPPRGSSCQGLDHVMFHGMTHVKAPATPSHSVPLEGLGMPEDPRL